MTIWKRACLGGLSTFAICLGVVTLAGPWTGVPPTFPPFSLLPLATACAAGALCGGLVFAALQRWTRSPRTWMCSLAALTVALSLALPYRLGYTQSPRFAGATPSAQGVLVLLHLVVGGGITWALTRGSSCSSQSQPTPRER